MEKSKLSKTTEKNKVVDKYVHASTRHKWLVGIDEVGRGPLAGPVTVGAVAILIDGGLAQTYKNLRKELMKISGRYPDRNRNRDRERQEAGLMKEYPIGVDSKKMKESDREFWYEVIQTLSDDGFLYACTSSASAGEIDRKGIAVCIKELVNENLKKISKIYKYKTKTSATVEQYEQMHVLFDGGLKTELRVGSQKTIIKGDEKEIMISLASVYAKVTRDTHMKKLSKNSKYSVYEFDIHKGYGTLKHRTVMQKHGLSDEHRKTFCKNIAGALGADSNTKVQSLKID
jgi:ribonuclease HII